MGDVVDLLTLLKSLSPQDSEKKVSGKCGQKKKFVVEIDEKYVNKKNHQMVTGNVHNREGIRQKYIFQFFNLQWKLKNIVGRSSCRGKGKRLQTTKTLAPPPHIYNGASLTPEDWMMSLFFSVKARPGSVTMEVALRLEAPCDRPVRASWSMVPKLTNFHFPPCLSLDPFLHEN